MRRPGRFVRQRGRLYCQGPTSTEKHDEYVSNRPTRPTRRSCARKPSTASMRSASPSKAQRNNLSGGPPDASSNAWRKWAPGGCLATQTHPLMRGSCLHISASRQNRKGILDGVQVGRAPRARNTTSPTATHAVGAADSPARDLQRETQILQALQTASRPRSPGSTRYAVLSHQGGGWSGRGAQSVTPPSSPGSFRGGGPRSRAADRLRWPAAPLCA